MHTQTRTHVDVCTKSILRNQVCTSWHVCWFNKQTKRVYPLTAHNCVWIKQQYLCSSLKQSTMHLLPCCILIGMYCQVSQDSYHVSFCFFSFCGNVSQLGLSNNFSNRYGLSTVIEVSLKVNSLTIKCS